VEIGRRASAQRRTWGGAGALWAIAEHLLDRGARLDLFAAAMLGKLAVVQAILEADPRALHVRGPHGIPLLAHAEAGGAAEVVAFLKSLEG
jgi:hypothetical protein